MVLGKINLKLPDLPDLFIHYLEEYTNIYLLAKDNACKFYDYALFREVDAKLIPISSENLINDFIEEQILQIPLIINHFEKGYEDKLTLRFLIKCVSNMKLSKIVSEARGSFTNDYYEQVLSSKVLPMINSYIDFYSKQLNVDYDKKYAHKKENVGRPAEIIFNTCNSDPENHYKVFREYMSRIIRFERDFTMFFQELEGQRKISSQRYELCDFSLQELCDVFKFMNKEAIITGNLKVLALWLHRKFFIIKNDKKVDISTQNTLEKYLKGKVYMTNIIKDSFK